MTYLVCYIFLIFKFLVIYLLHVLFVLKIKGIYLFLYIHRI